MYVCIYMILTIFAFNSIAYYLLPLVKVQNSKYMAAKTTKPLVPVYKTIKANSI